MTNTLSAGMAVVLTEARHHDSCRPLQPHVLYRIEHIRKVKNEEVMPEGVGWEFHKDFDHYRGKTLHDLMGADSFITVDGKEMSAAWVRPATASEVNRRAHSLL